MTKTQAQIIELFKTLDPAEQLYETAVQARSTIA
jgi:hypothetical protein